VAAPPDDDRLDDVLADVAPVEFAWRRTWVDERPALYGVAGEGLPVVFLHGWALGRRSYRHAIARLVALGCKVYAPNLPGFGRTPELTGRSFSFAGYADWVHGFLDALKITEPVFLIGHSFGGGVAVKVAHRRPERVRTLVLVNSVGGSAWSSAGGVRAITERPLWDWGLHFPTDVWPIPQATRVLPVVLEEALPNLVRNPRALWRVGQLARRADLTPELEDLKAKEVPVVVLWGARDGVIPRSAFDAMCVALGSEGEVVDGSHSWLLADPDHIGEIITNHVEVAQLAREMERHPTRRRRELRSLVPSIIRRRDSAR
jgi:pimeloyl-ACP methyl ester carboxylesterase